MLPLATYLWVQRDRSQLLEFDSCRIEPAGVHRWLGQTAWQRSCSATQCSAPWLPNLKKPKSWTGSSHSACTAMGILWNLKQIKKLDITAAAHLYSHFLPVVEDCFSSDGPCRGWALDGVGAARSTGNATCTRHHPGLRTGSHHMSVCKDQAPLCIHNEARSVRRS